MLKIELFEDKPGHATLKVANWKGSEQDIEISVKRSQDMHYYSQGNIWTPEPVWHKVSGLQLLGDHLLQGTLGPNLIDPLVQQVSNMQYQMFLRNPETEDFGVVRMVGNILASVAAGDSSRAEEVRAEPVVPVVVPEPLPEPVVEAPVEPIAVAAVNPMPVEKSPKKTSVLLPLLLILVVLALGAAASYFLLFNKSDSVPAKPAEEAAKLAPTPVPVVGDCDIAKLSGDSLVFIQTCLKSNPDNSQLLALIQQAKEKKSCDIAQRIYANKAQDGNAEIAVAYAKEYDPQLAVEGSCFKTDKDTAIYWYEVAVLADPNNAIAKQRLEELNK